MDLRNCGQQLNFACVKIKVDHFRRNRVNYWRNSHTRKNNQQSDEISTDQQIESEKIQNGLLDWGNNAFGGFFDQFKNESQILYTSNIKDVDIAEVQHLLELCFERSYPLDKLHTAISNSYSIQAVFWLQQTEQQKSKNSDQNKNKNNFSSNNSNSPQTKSPPQKSPPIKTKKNLVGFARTISDGQFAALIVDACVHPLYRRCGIGRTLINKIVREIRKKGEVQSIAAFPPPRRRKFFWNCGFRWNQGFTIMGYVGVEKIEKQQIEKQQIDIENQDDGFVNATRQEVIDIFRGKNENQSQ